MSKLVKAYHTDERCGINAFFHYLWKLFVFFFLMTLFNGTLLSCKQVPEKRTGQSVQPVAGQSYSLQNDPMVLQHRDLPREILS